jgi:hypothetical protein
VARQNEETKKGGLSIKLLMHLKLAPEARNEPSKGSYFKGRFKFFGIITKSNYSNLSTINAFTLLFILPFVAVFALFTIFGAENISYYLNSMSKPYLLSDFGIGLSTGTPIAEIRSAMMIPYKYFFLALAAVFPIVGIGFAGTLYFCTKLVWGESFITKKDKKFGADIPRIALEFFRGVKIYWKETALYFALFGLIFAGCGNLIVLFAENVYAGTINVGHYFGLIIGSIILLICTPVFLNLIPLAITYKMPIMHKIRNAFIVTLSFPITNIFLVVLLLLPFGAMMLGNIAMIIAVIFLVLAGFSIYSLLFVNYSDYISENIMVPYYMASIQADTKQTKKKTTSNVNIVSKGKKKKRRM